jgi:hypothetical protein
MAKYFLHVKVFSRGKGSRVTRAAAYRAGERGTRTFTVPRAPTERFATRKALVLGQTQPVGLSCHLRRR